MLRRTPIIPSILKVAFSGALTAVLAIVGVLLSSCAFVDHFTPRIYQNNLTFQDANSQEALLNIVRASRYEALSFVGIGQESGSQTETLATGFPTFTFGPAQTASQKQAVFGGNSLNSSAMGSFQVQPLVTSNFMQGMLTPITPKVLALLIGTYPREWIYYALIEGIKIIGYNKATKEKFAYYLRNDPADDQYNGIMTNDECRSHVPIGSKIYADDRLCNFSKFLNALGLAVQFGLTSEIVLTKEAGQAAANKPGSVAPAPSAAKGTNSPGAPQATTSSANATATPSSIGHLCWDPVLALPKYRKAVLTEMTNVCGRPVSTSTAYGFPFDTVIFTDVEFVFRSPYGVYKYLGKLLRENSAQRIRFFNIATFEERELDSGPFLNIMQGTSSDCLVTTFYNGQAYCVPRIGSNSTGMLLDILGQLKNLSTTPSDLNAVFAVRLID